MSGVPTNNKLSDYVKLGLVRSQTHPTLPLTIYVYTETTAFERLWNNVTLQCRGLVIDDKDRCIVRCLTKFFNEDEPHALCGIDWDDSPVVFDKLDGSLIQVVNDEEYGLVITSKGSFASDQAKWAKEIIDSKYKSGDFDKGKTYVFELIHPDNRIVVDYGGVRDLFLLAVVNIESGEEYDICDSSFDKFPRVKIIKDQEAYLKRTDIEGVVVKHGSHRYKLKTGEYLRLHRIVTNFTPKRVWESLAAGESLEFKNMPEEFETWLSNTINDFTSSFDNIKQAALAEYERTKEWSQKDVALGDVEHKPLVFMIRSGKDVAPAIWKLIKPRKGDSTDENITA